MHPVAKSKRFFPLAMGLKPVSLACAANASSSVVILRMRTTSFFSMSGFATNTKEEYSHTMARPFDGLTDTLFFFSWMRRLALDASAVDGKSHPGAKISALVRS